MNPLSPIPSLPAHRRRRGSLLAAAMIGLVAAAGSGCLGLGFKDPGQPLSARDRALRAGTREFAGTFSDAVAQAADSIRAGTTNPAVREAAMRWKLAASGAVREAALRSDPILALADLWVFNRQMVRFFETGAGARLFGEAAPAALAKARALETNVMALARDTLSAAEFQRMETFVEGHARDFGLADLASTREPVGAHWKGFEGATEPVASGTTPEAVADLAGRVALTGRQLRDEVAWRLELGSSELESTLQRMREAAEQLDQALRRIASVAEQATPALTSAVTTAASAVQAGFLPALERLETQWTNTLSVLRGEREAVTRDLARERAELVRAAGEQRQALMQEVDRTARAVTTQAMAEARGTLRELALYGVLLAVVVLGLPFAFGFLTGRVLGRHGRKSAVD